MKDGYYLSTYMSVGSEKQVLEVIERHDQSIALWKKNDRHIELIKYWELEELTGRRYHNVSFEINYAKKMITELLKEQGVQFVEEIWGTKELETSPIIIESPEDEFVLHGLFHNYSVLLSDMNLFRNGKILLLCADGEPDHNLEDIFIKKRLYSGSICISGEIKKILSIDSPGLLWTYVTKNYLKMDLIELLELTEIITTEVDPYDEEIPELKDMTAWGNAEKYVKGLVEYVDRLFKSKQISNYDERFTLEENKSGVIGKCLQKITISIMSRTIESILNEHNINPKEYHIAISGSMAANNYLITSLMSMYSFKDNLSVPYTTDSVQALGIGLYNFYKRMKDFDFQFKDVFLKKKAISYSINDYTRDCLKLTNDPIVVERIVEDIKRQPILWLQDSFSYNISGVGHRMILIDSVCHEWKSTINHIRERKWWRRLEVLVLAEEGHIWFENFELLQNMEGFLKLKKEKKGLLAPEFELYDNVKVCPVNSENNGVLYEILNAYKSETGIPMVFFTPISVCNEPILENVEQAIAFAVKKNLNVLYINGGRYVLNDIYKKEECVSSSRRFGDFLVYDTEKEREEMSRSINPHGISKEALITFFQNSKLNTTYNLKDEKDARKLERIADMTYQRIGVKK